MNNAITKFSERVEALYEQSRARDFGLRLEEFTEAVEQVVIRCLGASASPEDKIGFVSRLRSEELALAHACALGREKAWEHFIAKYRHKLYDLALSIAKEPSAAHDLAESLYADLYGTRANSDVSRISKLHLYSGRGSLEGWLKAVLAQEYVNGYRKERRYVSFDERLETGIATQPKVGHECEALTRAIDITLETLSPEERFLLASYFLDERTLAEIGKMLTVHESTISRKLEKLTVSLRKRIVEELRRSGMSKGAAEEALKSDVRDLPVDIRRHLVQGRRA